MKKFLLIFFAIFTSLYSFAFDVVVDGICYNLDSSTKTAEVTYGIEPSVFNSGSYGGDVVIPEEIIVGNDVYTVTSIGDKSFFWCANLSNISIPKSVTKIGNSAFSGCSNLVGVYISDIAAWCKISFYSNPIACRMDANLYLNNELVQDLVIPNSVTSISAGAFQMGKSITSVTLPNSIVSIGDDAFESCFNLKSVTLPNSLVSIGDRAFSNCGISTVTIPNSVVNIGGCTFNGCTSLTSVTIPSSVTNLSGGVFGNCISLSSVTLPNSLTSIGDFAFMYCMNLPSITLPNSLISIGKKALAYCPALETVYSYAENVPTTEADAFDHTDTEKATLFVPRKSLNRYSGQKPWSDFGTINAIEGDPVLVETITLNQTSAELHIGNTLQLTASIAPEDAEDKTVTWTSSNTDVATVSDAGLVTAKALGNATITATAGDGSGVTASCAITVSPVLATSITLNQTTISGNEGDVVQLVATVLPDNTTNKGVSWTSSNTAVASVSETGLVVINAVGNAVITATTVDGSNLSATCTVTGSAILVGGITLNTASADLHVGETVQLTALVTPNNATNKTVTWGSSNTDVAIVNAEGLVTALSLGNATITATAADGSGVTASCAITVSPVLATSITLNQTTIIGNIGENTQLLYTILPSNTTNKEVTWESSNPSVATVDQYGIVSFVGVGNAVITVKTTDGSNLSAACTAICEAIPVESITLNYTTLEVEADNSIQLTATVLPDNATNKNVIWESSNEDVASVSSSGKVMTYTPGIAIITAKSTDGSDVSAQCSIVVTEVKAQSISLNYNEYSLYLGESVQLIATVLPENTANKNVIWSSSNEDVMMVSSTGKVTCLADGVATITATTCDGTNLSASCVVERKHILVESIELNYNEAEIHVGETLQLEATVLPENAENKEISWASGAKSIATVDENGLVTAVREGSTTIVAMAQDGSGVKGRCSLTVLEVDGILNIIVNDTENIDIYSPDGKRLEKQRTGVNIIRNADGTVRKVFKK